MNIKYLLKKAKSGQLKDVELAYVGQRLQCELDKKAPSDDLYTLIHIIGKADFEVRDGVTHTSQPSRTTQYRPILEQLLHYPEDPDIATIALKSLCTYWNDTKSYLKELKDFIEGVDWDEDQELFITAIGIAGEYLRESPNVELSQLLVDILEKEQKKDPSSLETEALLEAIARSSRKS